MLRRISRILYGWNVEHSSRKELENLPDEALAEIGLAREDIPYAIRDISRKTQVGIHLK